MKKSALGLSIFITLSISSRAQDNYFSFKINGKHGITDTAANEIVKPQYKYLTLKPDHAVLLQNFDNTKDMLLNRQTGKKYTSERIQENRVMIANDHYYLMQNDKKSQLLQVVTGEIIPLNEEYYEIANQGKYLIAKYYPHAKPIPKTGQEKQVWKKGAPPPPPIIMELTPLDGLTIFNNIKPLTTAFEGPFRDYIILYKTEEEKPENDDDVPQVVTLRTITIEQRDEPVSPDFFAILLRNYNTNNLYSYDLKLIDSFKEQDYDKEQAIAKTREILKQDVTDWDSRPNDNMGTISAPPNAVYSSKDRVATKPKINYPVLTSTKLNTGYEQVVLQQAEDVQVKLFRTKKKFSISGDEITIDGAKESNFKVNMKTGKVGLPKKYWQILGLLAN